MRRRALGAATLVLVLALIPAVVTDRGTLYFMTLIMIWCVFALGYDLVFGVTGLLSFGHAAFLGSGAYVYAFIMIREAALFPVAILVAGLSSGVLALIVGAFALRLSGIYFSLTTLAIAELVFFIASSPLRDLTGGEDGLTGVPRPSLFRIDFYDDARYYLLVLVFFAAALGASKLLRDSPFGKVLSGIRLNETRAEQVGFNVKAHKLAIFGVSGVYSGIAGALLGSLMQFVNPQGLHWSISGDVVIMTLLGGLGTLFGPVIGVAAFEGLRELISSYTVHWYGGLGLIFILATIFMPEGIHGALRAAKVRIAGRRAR